MFLIRDDKAHPAPLYYISQTAKELYSEAIANVRAALARLENGEN
jgi:hypothetical protein